ncbi:YopX family protein [Bacillus cereus]|nr:YopX family protein [Bacillus cereus]
MRIMYRAWDNVKDKMYSVGEEDDISFGFESNGIVAYDLTEDDEEFHTLHHLQYMRYTGLKDKNGDEIFEGDIVHFKAEGLSGLGAVYWKDDVAQFWIRDIRPRTQKRGERHYPFYENARYRIDGNIHENKELLKGVEA